MPIAFWPLLLQSFLIVVLGLLILYIGRSLAAWVRPQPAYASRAELEADYQNARIDVGRYLAEKERLRK